MSSLIQNRDLCSSSMRTVDLTRVMSAIRLHAPTYHHLVRVEFNRLGTTWNQEIHSPPLTVNQAKIGVEEGAHEGYEQSFALTREPSLDELMGKVHGTAPVVTPKIDDRNITQDEDLLCGQRLSSPCDIEKFSEQESLPS